MLLLRYAAPSQEYPYPDFSMQPHPLVDDSAYLIFKLWITSTVDTLDKIGNLYTILDSSPVDSVHNPVDNDEFPLHSLN